METKLTMARLSAGSTSSRIRPGGNSGIWKAGRPEPMAPKVAMPNWPRSSAHTSPAVTTMATMEDGQAGLKRLASSRVSRAVRLMARVGRWVWVM